MTYKPNCPYIVYHSLTGNTERFMDKINLKITSTFKLKTGDELYLHKFILSTYTIKFGEIPDIIDKFMFNNHENCVGIIANGNKNWGELYCNAGKLLSNKYNIPLLMTYELSGLQENVDKLNQILLNYYNDSINIFKKNFFDEQSKILRFYRTREINK